MQLQPMLLALAGCKRQNVAREREHVFEKEAIFRSREQQRKSRLLLLLLLQSDQAIYGELDEPSHFLLLLSFYSAIGGGRTLFHANIWTFVSGIN